MRLACHCSSSSSSSSYAYVQRNYKAIVNPSKRPNFLLFCSIDFDSDNNTVVSKAVRLLGGPARFEASKLKVVVKNKYSGIIPRTYILSHCDFTANLTLTISHVINLEQLRGWYTKDDVVAEWKKVNGEMCLHVHCFVSGPNLLFDLAAEIRYRIFSKELPLVLKAVVYGDSLLFAEQPELFDSLVRVYFHSGLQKYNKMESWGPLRDAIEGRQEDRVIQGSLSTNTSATNSTDSPTRSNEIGSPKSIFQVLFAFLL